MSDSEPSGRPRPQYGEYSTPEEQRAAIKQPEPWQLEEEQADGVDAAQGASGTPGTPTVPGTYQPGGEHNPGSPQADPRQFQPPRHPGPSQYPGRPPYPGQQYRTPYAPYSAPRTRSGTGDRIGTIVLLGFGLWNVIDMVVNAVSGGEAVRSSAELMSPGQSQLINGMPGWLWIGGAAAYVLVWLIALFTSLASLRAGRITFWIPLLAGVLAAIVFLALMVIAVGENPALLHIVPTPTGTGTGSA